MPSPFPGMDPYLEDPAFWADFHAAFLTYLRDAINERLPDNYEARVWAKLRDQLPEKQQSWLGAMLPPRQWAIAGAMAGLLVVETVFSLGKNA